MPEIVPDWEGTVFTLTLRVRGLLLPQLLIAITEMVPPFEPAVVVIEVDDELPLQPDGKVQEYDVAPVTGDML